MLDFEHELRPLESELELVKKRTNGTGDHGDESRLVDQINVRLGEIYRNLTPWQKVQVARHRERPYTLDYLQMGFGDYLLLAGDRSFAEDRAIVGGPALLDGRTIMVIGHQKGRSTRENLNRNFGMPHPEGYRKAERLMLLAERLGLPVVTFVDTPGAHAGLEDEERGQAEAIAHSISTMLALRIPTVCVIVGEGGSGGALALAVADRVLMLEHATFTVASPEAAAAILWRDSAKAPTAAENMRITAQDLRQLGLIDEIVPEPLGGAHRDHAMAARSVIEAIGHALGEIADLSPEDRLDRRYHKYRDLRFYQE
jgi:acetyl-CoA carboxylase carboxyl transferase subunit alpha